MRVVIFDTETTGLLLPSSAPLEKQPRIIELGICVVVDGKLVSEHNWLMHPGCDVSAEITKITGITNADLIGKPSFLDLLNEVKVVFFGSDLGIAHNAPFDVGMISNELKRIGCEDFPWPTETICTAQEYTPMIGKRPRLIHLYERVMGKPLAQTHRALDDAKAVLDILLEDKFFEKIGG